MPFVLLIVFLGSLTRAVFGFGDSVVAMPLLALLPLPLNTAISLIGLMGLTVAIFAILTNPGKTDKQTLGILSLSTFAGVPAGLLLVLYVSQNTVTKILGFFLILYAIYSLFKQRNSWELPENFKKNRLFSVPFGFLAGCLGSAYNMNGIPIVVYGTLRDWEMDTFQGTLQSHFLISSTMVIIGQALGGFWSKELFFYYLCSMPVILLAGVTGKKVRTRIPVARFERLLFIFILLLGLILFISSR